MLKLNKQKFALAAASTMAITYFICVLFTALAPELALKFLGWMFHLLNIEKFAGKVGMTFGGVILGFLPLLFYSYIFGWLFAWFYNRLNKNENLKV